jgi:HEAT repeat protein
MNTLARLLAAGIFIAAFMLNASAAEDVHGLTPEKYALAEQNLLVGIASDNQGLKESAACMLGDLQSTRAVIPLMDMLRTGETESVRIVAALALCRIGDLRGVYAVKRATTFDESENVQQKCAWFYNQYVQAGTFDIALQVAEYPMLFALR